MNESIEGGILGKACQVRIQSSQLEGELVALGERLTGDSQPTSDESDKDEGRRIGSELNCALEELDLARAEIKRIERYLFGNPNVNPNVNPNNVVCKSS